MEKRVIASPLARYLAKKYHINLYDVKPTGPQGRIIKRDIELVLSQKTDTSANQLPSAKLFFKEEEYEIVNLSPMHQSIAQRLTASKSEIPHYYTTMECHIDPLDILRKKINQTLQDNNSDEKITLNDCIIRASALALKAVPEVNVSYEGQQVLKFHHADISIAVALEGGGLITPIIKKAEKKNLREISQEAKELAKLSAEMRLKPEQYEGGTFSISNLGMFGISEFTAIINPPQAAILAVGGVSERLVSQNNHIKTHRFMKLTLSSDHRVINGAEAAKFLQACRKFIEQPWSLLL